MNTQTGMTRHEDRQMESTRERALVAPPVDVYENSEELLLVADVPGGTKDAVSIHFDKDQVTLSAQRGEGENACEYRRAFVVPPGIDASRISAELSNGVLRVHLPKSEAIKPRQIPIRAG